MLLFHIYRSIFKTYEIVSEETPIVRLDNSLHAFKGVLWWISFAWGVLSARVSGNSKNVGARISAVLFGETRFQCFQLPQK